MTACMPCKVAMAATATLLRQLVQEPLSPEARAETRRVAALIVAAGGHIVWMETEKMVTGPDRYKEARDDSEVA